MWLRRKVTIAFFVVSAAVSVLLVLFLYRFIERQLAEELRNRLMDMAEMGAAEVELDPYEALRGQLPAGAMTDEQAKAVEHTAPYALIGRTPAGEMMFTNQPTVNANFLGWTSLDGTQLTDFTLAKNQDGRLEMVAIGGDTAAYDKPQARPDLEWSSWSAVGQSLQSGVPIESTRVETVHATQPTTSTYRLDLSKEIPNVGPIPWGADFGTTGLPTGKLIPLKNPYPYYVMSVIGPQAPNTDCWTSKAVTLYAGRTTTASDITKLYGTATPAVPLHIHTCLSTNVSGYAQIDVTYTH